MKTLEESLWCSVLDRALQDATTRLKPGRRFAQCGSNTSNTDIQQARAWFRRRYRSFVEACDFAGLDPEVVRSHAMERIAELEAMEDRAERNAQGITSNPPRQEGAR